MRRFFAVFALVLVPAVASAQQSVTVRDIVELSKAGLSEESLLALIEVNRPIFPNDVDTLKTLKAAGVPPNVITAMIRSGRTSPPPEVEAAPPVDPYAPYADAVPPAAPPPQVVVIDHRDDSVAQVPVAVPVYPVYVTVPTFPSRRVIHRELDQFGRPVAPAPVAPVYWGWGGKLRPDAWNPATVVQPDARITPQRR